MAHQILTVELTLVPLNLQYELSILPSHDLNKITHPLILVEYFHLLFAVFLARCWGELISDEVGAGIHYHHYFTAILEQTILCLISSTKWL